MAKEKLYTKERWYADTRKEAEEIVAEAKENDFLTMQKIHEKHNSKGFYFLVDLDYTYSTAKEEMDKRPEDDAPDGQMNMDEVHEGVPYTVNSDGSVTVENTNEELPEFEDPFANVEAKQDASNENVPF
ncbi:organic solvent tolerance protein OstA [Lysinibacillus pakistanensis]|uniref:Organic solvent tolerance protein OstA n=1 Tax=Lysinibacillus pakistanensis TaxID=759811 RepID=A0AAX3WR07_9BACI|nr:organic solvent tolerance protein OstA [Lysinibacillus pakistanensis]MDM5229660.1 organic solvent tolerance protein OstA [Lysinibacillus pakistanensis]WHY45277.1 organic solvent tolerance protein OstA [Lysinibacillus pakistanensis]WHY50285.1 organic solvent tolerance protein OstA [Lysinibacillus pakistanensis]